MVVIHFDPGDDEDAQVGLCKRSRVMIEFESETTIVLESDSESFGMPLLVSMTGLVLGSI